MKMFLPSRSDDRLTSIPIISPVANPICGRATSKMSSASTCLRAKFLTTVPFSMPSVLNASSTALTFFSFPAVSVIINWLVLEKTDGDDMRFNTLNSLTASSASISPKGKMHLTTSKLLRLANWLTVTKSAMASNCCMLRGSDKLITVNSFPLRTKVNPCGSKNKLTRSNAPWCVNVVGSE